MMTNINRVPAAPSDVAQFFMRSVSSQHGNLVLTLDGRLCEQTLGRAIRKSMDIVPVVGSRFVEHWYRPYFERRNDLDQLELVRVIENVDDQRAALMDFLTAEIDPRYDPFVQATIFRGQHDKLCLKCSHLAGDAPALMYYLSLIQRLYNGDLDPDQQPPARWTRNGARIISRHFGLRHRFRILRHVLDKMGEKRGRWILPGDNESPNEPYYVTCELSPEKTKQVSAYALKKKTTVTVVYLAAVYRTLKALFPFTTAEGLGVGTTIDLRNYLPMRKRPRAFENLSGPSRMYADPSVDCSFDELVESFREQFQPMYRARLLGTNTPGLWLAFPLLRGLTWMVPFSYLKSRLAKAYAGLPERQGATIMFANAGAIATSSLGLGDCRVADAYFTPSTYSMGGLAMGVMTVNDHAVMALGAKPRLIGKTAATQLLERISLELDATKVAAK